MEPEPILTKSELGCGADKIACYGIGAGTVALRIVVLSVNYNPLRVGGHVGLRLLLAMARAGLKEAALRRRPKEDESAKAQDVGRDFWQGSTGEKGRVGRDQSDPKVPSLCDLMYPPCLSYPLPASGSMYPVAVPRDLYPLF